MFSDLQQQQQKKCNDIATVCHNFRILSVSRTRFVRSTVELPLGAGRLSSGERSVLKVRESGER